MLTDEVFILQLIMMVGADNSTMKTFLFVDHIEKVGGHPGTVFRFMSFSLWFCWYHHV